MRFGPVQSYELAVSVGTLAELIGYDTFVDGGSCRLLSTGELWLWHPTLPAGVVSSVDGSSGAVRSTTGNFWVLDGVQSSAVCYADVTSGDPVFIFNRGFASILHLATGDYRLTLATLFAEEQTHYVLTLLDANSSRSTSEITIFGDGVTIRVQTFSNAVATDVDFQLSLKRIVF